MMHRRLIIDAEISGDYKCQACGIAVSSDAPVLALCRALIDVGYNPSQPLHAYRGKALALKVRSIGEGARLRVATGRNGRPSFMTDFRYSPSPASAPD